MARTNVTITTEDGTCAGTFHTPDADGGPVPGVLLYPDAAGARETFAGMGDRLAGLGYAVLVPDLYYRNVGWAPFDTRTVFTDPDERARLGTLASELTQDRRVADAGAFLDFLASRAEVADTPVGTTGYCMGGRMALNAAAHYPDRVGAAASFHGGNLAPEDDADGIHRKADWIRAAVYVGVAEDDSSFPADQYERLALAFADAGITHTMVTYEAAHGFAVPDNETYDQAAADRHWAALTDLYATLRG
jgi:carboxymethylenebutenolidase